MGEGGETHAGQAPWPYRAGGGPRRTMRSAAAKDLEVCVDPPPCLEELDQL